MSQGLTNGIGASLTKSQIVFTPAGSIGMPDD